MVAWALKHIEFGHTIEAGVKVKSSQCHPQYTYSWHIIDKLNNRKHHGELQDSYSKDFVFKFNLSTFAVSYKYNNVWREGFLILPVPKGLVECLTGLRAALWACKCLY